MTADDRSDPTDFTVEDVCEIVATAITRRYGGEPPILHPDTEMLTQGMIDSMTRIRIVRDLESRLGFPPPPSLVIARNFRTPTTLYGAISPMFGHR